MKSLNNYPLWTFKVTWIKYIPKLDKIEIHKLDQMPRTKIDFSHHFHETNSVNDDLEWDLSITKLPHCTCLLPRNQLSLYDMYKHEIYLSDEILAHFTPSPMSIYNNQQNIPSLLKFILDTANSMTNREFKDLPIHNTFIPMFDFVGSVQ